MTGAWAGFAPAAVAAAPMGPDDSLLLDAKAHRSAEEIPENEKKHLILVLDVSPSMRLKDAGPEHKQSRLQRARDVLDSMFGRVGIRQYLITVIATYNGAIPVVDKSRDPEVLRNILSDLPMHYAFPKGSTDLFAGLEEAAKRARPLRPHSATLVLVTDGDTVPATGMPKMPVAIEHKLVIGIGDSQKGTFIDGRHSRQEASILRQIAIRLGGVYHDGNEKHVGSNILQAIARSGETRSELTWRIRALGPRVRPRSWRPAAGPAAVGAWGAGVTDRAKKR
jgi:Ca-activated chloride channel family protein